jgi:hypothetical protein
VQLSSKNSKFRRKFAETFLCIYVLLQLKALHTISVNNC